MIAKKILLQYLLLFLQLSSHNSLDIITTNETFPDGKLLVSENGKFAFGFFTPGRSIHRYVGVWFHKISELSVVWVANRNSPINGSSGFLSLDQHGNLVLYNDPRQKIPLWSTNVSSEADGSRAAQLLDSGNLVLFQGEKRRILWQSFDYLTDAFLPGTKVGMNYRTGQEWSLTSWRSKDDPGVGEFSLKIDPRGTLQVFLFEGSKPRWRAHVWPYRKFSNIYNYSYVYNQEEAYMAYNINDDSVLIRVMVDHRGVYKWIRWSESDVLWKEFWSAPKYPCDVYAQCGAYGKCSASNSDAFECSCLPGYEPRSPRDWYLRDASGGCVRKRVKSSPVCRNGEGFLKVENVKFPDTSFAGWLRMNMSRLDCEWDCLRNCSCTAYASITSNDSGSCLTWYGELIDTVERTEGRLDIYVRVDAIELAENAMNTKLLLTKGLKILVLSVASAWFTVTLLAYLWIKKKKRVTKNKRAKGLFAPATGSIYYKNALVARELGQSSDPQDILFFDHSTIVAATDNFSPANKLGQGGFGVVYKGQLSDGKEVAVKRLSTNSGQGTEEFKNEVMLIAKLQHRNLVKLLGCCMEREEQMLVYEYLPNKSLDSFLFDEARKSLLDWRKRFAIITGTARGILYLHQDSRLPIIHRDLKCSNILLDVNMNPKISDFGMARILRIDQIQEKTNRVVGTYGYMSPEYALFGKFSVKSDVFSFGVILLEIVSAKKSNGFHEEDPTLSLIGLVWKLYTEARALEIVDPTMEGSYHDHEILRCIQIGLLCVQDDAADRPTMLEVLLMLNSETAIPSPKEPAFTLTSSRNFKSQRRERSNSMNEITISTFLAR